MESSIVIIFESRILNILFSTVSVVGASVVAIGLLLFSFTLGFSRNDTL
jgi:hypothetical protein